MDRRVALLALLLLVPAALHGTARHGVAAQVSTLPRNMRTYRSRAAPKRKKFSIDDKPYQ